MRGISILLWVRGLTNYLHLTKNYSWFSNIIRAPKVANKKWDGFYQNFFGVEQQFYLKQPSFSTVEWNFCKWAKYNKLFIEHQNGVFSLNQNTAIVTQGDGDFGFLHTSLQVNKSKILTRILRDSIIIYGTKRQLFLFHGRRSGFR